MHARPGVTPDDVAVRGSRAADGVVGGGLADPDPLPGTVGPVTQRGGAGGVGADVVASDDVARRVVEGDENPGGVPPVDDEAADGAARAAQRQPGAAVRRAV